MESSMHEAENITFFARGNIFHTQSYCFRGDYC